MRATAAKTLLGKKRMICFKRPGRGAKSCILCGKRINFKLVAVSRFKEIRRQSVSGTNCDFTLFRLEVNEEIAQVNDQFRILIWNGASVELRSFRETQGSLALVEDVRRTLEALNPPEGTQHLDGIGPNAPESLFLRMSVYVNVVWMLGTNNVEFVDGCLQKRN